MKIEVTQQDIDQGIRLNCAKCPIARAVRRHFPEATVGNSWVMFSFGGKESRLPAEAREFTIRFDTWLDVAPFSFELEVPGED